MDEPHTSMILEGFICPECQQDMTSIELLQAHFDLMHLKKTNSVGSNLASFSSSSSTNSYSSQDTYFDSSNNRSKLSSVIAKAKTLISASTNNEIQNLSDQTNIIIGNTNSTDLSSGSNHLTATQQINNSPTNNSLVSNLVLKQYFNSNQSIGCFQSHTAYFKQTRDHTVGRYVIQTNKLLITLDKLVSIDSSIYSDDTKREAYFKTIVPWVLDMDVRLCPNCAKSFSLLNRKHHCRLCGAIMCNKCSKFLSFSLARKLTDPDSFVKAMQKQQQHQTSSSENLNEFKLRRSESINSVNTYIFKSHPTVETNSNNEQINKKKPNLDLIYLRLCMNCSDLLAKKFQSIRDKLIRPIFLNIYDELCICMNESKRLYPIYTKMAESLNFGEAIYQLRSAEEMRLKLIKHYQTLEILSAQLLKHEADKASPDQLKLQRNIRFQSINFLKEYSFTLSQLPTSEVYFKLKAQRELRLQEELRRVELQQLKQDQEIRKRIKSNNNPTGSNKTKFPSISIDNSNGWMPSSVKALLLDDSQSAEEDDDYDDNDDNEDTEEEKTLDLNKKKEVGDDNKSISSHKKKESSEKEKALRVQIQLVEKYLDDALKQNKHDEATLLRKNLNELLNSLVDI